MTDTINEMTIKELAESNPMPAESIADGWDAFNNFANKHKTILIIATLLAIAILIVCIKGFR